MAATAFGPSGRPRHSHRSPPSPPRPPSIRVGLSSHPRPMARSAASVPSPPHPQAIRSRGNVRCRRWCAAPSVAVAVAPAELRRLLHISTSGTGDASRPRRRASDARRIPARYSSCCQSARARVRPCRRRQKRPRAVYDSSPAHHRRSSSRRPCRRAARRPGFFRSSQSSSRRPARQARVPGGAAAAAASAGPSSLDASTRDVERVAPRLVLSRGRLPTIDSCSKCLFRGARSRLKRRIRTASWARRDHTRPEKLIDWPRQPPQRVVARHRSWRGPSDPSSVTRCPRARRAH